MGLRGVVAHRQEKQTLPGQGSLLSSVISPSLCPPQPVGSRYVGDGFVRPSTGGRHEPQAPAPCHPNRIVAPVSRRTWRPAPPATPIRRERPLPPTHEAAANTAYARAQLCEAAIGLPGGGLDFFFGPVQVVGKEGRIMPRGSTPTLACGIHRGHGRCPPKKLRHRLHRRP